MNTDNRVKIVQAGALHPCITLLRSSERRVQEQALGCIRDLSVNPDNKVRVGSHPPRITTGP
jgi:hypothetical protein